MAAVAPAPAGVPLHEKLALAQATAQVGTSDWAGVSQLLETAQAQVATFDKSAKASSALFTALLAEHNLTKSSQPAQALASKLYSQQIADLISSVKESIESEASLKEEIEQINAGEFDDELLAAAPESKRSSIAASRSPSAKPGPTSDDKPNTKSQPSARKASRRNGRKGDEDSTAEEGGAVEIVPESDTDVEATTKKDKSKGKEKELTRAEKKRERDEKEKEKSSPVKGRASARKSGRTKGKAAEEEEETQEEEEEDEPDVQEEEEEEEDEEEDDEEQEDDAEDEDEEEEEEGEPPATRGSSRRKQSQASAAKAPAPKSGGRASKRLKTEEAHDEGGSEVVTDKEAKAKVQRFKATAKGLIANLLGKPNAQAFANPVTDRIAKGYKTAVLRPMSLIEVQRNVKAEKISTLSELQRDVVLVFANAIQFNGPESELGKQANELWQEFEQLYHIALTTEFSHAD